MNLSIKNFLAVAAVSLLASCTATGSGSDDAFAKRRARFSELSTAELTLINSRNLKGGLNKNFYYLTGSQDTTSVLVIEDGSATIYCPSGAKPQIEGVEFKEIAQIDADVKSTVASGVRLGVEKPMVEICSHEFGVDNPISNVDSIIFSMRVIKDSLEVKQLREACLYTSIGINKLMKELAAGINGVQMDSIMQQSYAEQGANGTSFSNAASGESATPVHSEISSDIAQDGEMVLVDIGALSGLYTADISRSMPVNGKFTKEQLDIYNIVWDAQKEGMKHLHPGGSMVESEKVAADYMVDRLAELGLITDKSSPWQRKFYIQHGFSHHIGLDIHDVWYWFKENTPEDIRQYKAGMVVTFEPGLYFPKNYLAELADKLEGKVDRKEVEAFVKQVEPIYNKYIGIGIRIEESILITPTGQEVLTTVTPNDPKAIEAMMASK